MQLTVKGKHLNVGDSLREHVYMNLSHTAEKYFREPIEATVVFTKEKNHLYRADISIHVGSGIVLQTHHEADDPYPAFDVAAKHVAKRLSKYKDKLRDHHRWEDPHQMDASYYTLQSNENAKPAKDPAIIAEMQTQVLTLAVADAVMRLELGDLPALMFRNPKHGNINLVYRRKDGNIGWVDPQILGAEKTKEPAAKKALKKPVKKNAVKAKKKKTNKR
jgi:ribosomal subunit interface protein